MIQHNAFYAHPENILLAMITDQRANIRELGYRKIMKARKLEGDKTGERQVNPEATEARKSRGRPKKKSRVEMTGIRVFQIPTLNFEAKDYYELISWEEGTVTPPPILAYVSGEDLYQFVTNSEHPAVDFVDFPCHTQSVERIVKVVQKQPAAASESERETAPLEQSSNRDR